MKPGKSHGHVRLGLSANRKSLQEQITRDALLGNVAVDYAKIPADAATTAGLGRWCLPSGKPLGEFALQSGFAAPRLWHASLCSAFAQNDQATWLAPFRGNKGHQDVPRRIVRASSGPTSREY
ncbi:MAG TPA: hypothetical protein VM120_02245 [Bryobacteraceae bacterium]|nr:hypothetical protein [Bryobacteraceae bacterium]